MKELKKLLDVKSIITILCTVCFIYLSFVNSIDSNSFMTVFTVIVSFYFGTQYEKNINNKE